MLTVMLRVGLVVRSWINRPRHRFFFAMAVHNNCFFDPISLVGIQHRWWDVDMLTLARGVGFPCPTLHNQGSRPASSVAVDTNSEVGGPTCVIFDSYIVNRFT